jgi:hypothetical protein
VRRAAFALVGFLAGGAVWLLASAAAAIAPAGWGPCAGGVVWLALIAAVVAAPQFLGGGR